jgi:hypothetical protein
LIVKDVVQPIYDKFKEYATRREIEFSININFPSDFNVHVDKDGIGLILTSVLHRAFMLSKSKESIDIVLSLKDIDEDY